VLILGKVATALLSGDEETQAQRNLEISIQRFNAALAHFGHGVGFKTYEQVEGWSQDIN